jgi:FixJ family two-component response regulator
MTNLRSAMLFARCLVPSAIASKPTSPLTVFCGCSTLCGMAVSLPMFACRAWTELSLSASSRVVQIPLPVVVISGHADVPMAVAAIKAGAEDFIEKPIDDVQLVAAINRGLAGVYAQRRFQERIQDLRTRFDRLTPREVEVLDLVVQGYTSEAIAERLEISTRTVEGYRVQIMNKMQAESVAVLVRQAIRLNLISP